MPRSASRVLVLVAAAALACQMAVATTARVARATTTDGAIVGVSPGWNIDAEDATLGPDIGTFDSCAGNLTPGYVHDMNDWQGKHNTVINFYTGFDSASTANIFGYTNKCNNSQFVPFIWDNYDAIPMQTGEMAPPESEATCADGTSNPYACFSDSSGAADTGLLQSYGKALNKWLNSADTYGQAAPAAGRRMYIRFNWESNGTWVPWGPAAVTYPSTAGNSPLIAPVYADNCTDLFNAEMFNVAWWRYVHSTVDSQITPPAGETVSSEVNWVYSQFAYNPLALTNDLGQDYFAPAVQNCPAVTNTVYTSTQPVHPSDLIQALYPGDDATDWTGLDGYATCSQGSSSLSLSSAAAIFGTYVNDLHSITTKPVSVDEVGAETENERVPCATAQAKSAWLSDYMTFVQNNNIRMSIYFNDDENKAANGVDDDAVFCPLGTDSECLTDQSSANIYTGSDTGVPTVYGVYHAYRQGLQSSWWETPDPAQTTATGGRVMDDATFNGTW